MFSRIACVTRWAGLAACGLALPLAAAESQAPAVPVRNVILMIGDGMGFAHVALTEAFSGQPPALRGLPCAGEVQTASADKAVTDSAAAGTALACGRKTCNGMLGQLPDGTPLTSVARQAQAAGRRVGILTSVPINHATPAAFYASVTNRGAYYAIGLQALASGFQVLGGNGFSDAEGRNHAPRPETSLWDCAAAAGYTVVRTPAALQAHGPEAGPLLIAPARLHAETGVPQGRAFDPEKDITLAQMTARTLELLEGPQGFFLMVEGGAIDWAAHANDALGVIAETLAFDAAVAEARAFAEMHPDTLLIVTADHETGGLSLQDGFDAARARTVLGGQTAMAADCVAWLRRHVAEAAGTPDAGWEDAQKELGRFFGLAAETFAGLRADYAQLAAAPDKERSRQAAALARAAARLRDQAAGVSWSTLGHTAAQVPLFASGPGAERFQGVLDNTQICLRLRALLGLPDVSPVSP